MKRKGNLFGCVTDFNHLCLSARKAAIGTQNFDSLGFMADVERQVLVLQSELRRLVKDPDVLRLTDLFIDKGAPGSLPGKGLPIGNLTSQNFANLYLGPFDHFMREVVGIPGYVRYMDDILMFGHDRNSVRNAVAAAASLMSALRLELKTEVCVRGRVADGVPFLGFRIFPSIIRFDHARARRFARKVREVTRQGSSGVISPDRQVAVMQSVIGWARVGDTAAYTRGVFRRDEGEI